MGRGCVWTVLPRVGEWGVWTRQTSRRKFSGASTGGLVVCGARTAPSRARCPSRLAALHLTLSTSLAPRVPAGKPNEKGRVIKFGLLKGKNTVSREGLVMENN